MTSPSASRENRPPGTINAMKKGGGSLADLRAAKGKRNYQEIIKLSSRSKAKTNLVITETRYEYPLHPETQCRFNPGVEMK